MAHQKEKELPLLMDQLSVPEKVMLGQTMHGPGFKIVIRLLDEMCRRFEEAVKLLDPEEADYAHRLSVRVPRARNADEFRNLLVNSIKLLTKGLNASVPSFSNGDFSNRNFSFSGTKCLLGHSPVIGSVHPLKAAMLRAW